MWQKKKTTTTTTTRWFWGPFGGYPVTRGPKNDVHPQSLAAHGTRVLYQALSN